MASNRSVEGPVANSNAAVGAFFVRSSVRKYKARLTTVQRDLTKIEMKIKAKGNIKSLNTASRAVKGLTRMVHHFWDPAAKPS